MEEPKQKMTLFRKFFYLLIAVCVGTVIIALIFAVAEKIPQFIDAVS